MKIPTTITIEMNGWCILEQDVTVDVTYEVRRNGTVSWAVDDYLISGCKRVWDDTAGTWETRFEDCGAPEALAKCFDAYLDRKHIEEELHERLYASGELSYANAYRAAV